MQQQLCTVHRRPVERGGRLLPHNLLEHGVLQLSHFHVPLRLSRQYRPGIQVFSIGLQKGGDVFPGSLPRRLLQHYHVRHDHHLGLLHHPGIHAFLLRDDSAVHFLWPGRWSKHHSGEHHRHKWLLRGTGNGTVRHLGSIGGLCHGLRCGYLKMIDDHQMQNMRASMYHQRLVHGETSSLADSLNSLPASPTSTSTMERVAQLDPQHPEA